MQGLHGCKDCLVPQRLILLEARLEQQEGDDEDFSDHSHTGFVGVTCVKRIHIDLPPIFDLCTTLAGGSWMMILLMWR